ncbi:MAG: Adenylate cyclase 1 [Pelotomaculum sp. PtaU1.Bin035]|nr:MAG: Adenylate cyclase 1 [Pelotomaculum sp. PtaU1.Bin035]
MSKIFSSGKRDRVVILCLLVTGLMLLAVKYDILVYLERLTVDTRVTACQREPSPEIVIVGITSDDLAKMVWPWPRGMHANIIDIIASGGPKVIGYDIVFNNPSADAPDQDRLLAEKTAAAKNVIFPFWADKIWTEKNIAYGKDFTRFPFKELMVAANSLGHNTFLGDPDKVVRRVALMLATEQDIPVDSFPMAVLKEYYGIKDNIHPSAKDINFNGVNIPLDEKGLVSIAYAGPPGRFPVIPVSALLSGDVNPEIFKDKIVLFGSTHVATGNFYYSPFGKAMMTEVEMHANIIDAVITKRFFENTSPATNMAVVVILGIFMGLVLPRLSPSRGFTLALAVLAACVASVYFIGTKAHLLAQVVYPAFTIILCYVAATIYGYIQERREKQKITQTFSRYVAPQVVNEILKADIDMMQMKSRRQMVTVLFVDLSGFTPLSEKLPPEDLVNVLNRYLKLVIEIIFKYEGTIDKFIGDAVMVEFNAPIPVPDHELRAVKSALDILKGLSSLSDEVEREFEVKLNVSIGINTGEVIIGNIGALTRVEFAAIGDNVNIAARLQSFANAGQIVISSSTYEAVHDRAVCNPLGPVRVKGKANELEVYEVTGLKDTIVIQ